MENYVWRPRGAIFISAREQKRRPENRTASFVFSDPKGVSPVAAVAMHEYAEGDVEQFVADRCARGPGAVGAQQMFAHYQRWARANGRYQVGQHVFGRVISRRFPKVLLEGRVSYLNVALRGDLSNASGA